MPLDRYLDRIIRGTDLQEFAATLQQHQKAVTSDGKGCFHFYAVL